MKQAVISGVLFSTILLAGCNGEQKEEQVQMTEVIESEQELDGISNLLSELQNEITVSITEQTELCYTPAISLGGNPVKEMIVSVGFPKDVKVDDTMIQQIIKDSIKKVSETENVTISEENITIKIEKY